VYGEDASGSEARAQAVATAQRDTGAGVVRIPFIWSRIEVMPGVMDLREQDAAVLAATEAGLEVLPFLIDAPLFRAAPTTSRIHLPLVFTDLGVFAAAMVRRYGPGGTFWAQHPELAQRPIRAWQVWNEPNLPVDWPPAPDPVAYAELLRVTAAALRQADRGVEVVAAGLPDSDMGVGFEQYVAQLYAAGAARSFDAFALHAYRPSAQATIELVRYVRGLMDAHGDSTTPLDVTEFGWASNGPVKPQTTTEDGQAQRVGDVMRTLGVERGPLRLERLVYFSWRDRTVSAGTKDQWPYHTGLLRTDAGPKPALTAFKSAAKALALPGDEGPVLAETPPAAPAAGAPPRKAAPFDHRPRMRLLGPRRQPIGQALKGGWRVRVSCLARCTLRLRLIVPGRTTGAHARLVLRRAGSRTVRLVVRSSLHRTLSGRRTIVFALELADASRVPLRVVARTRLEAER
jgi:hypothetical protein